MKWVFVLVLLIIMGSGLVLGGVVAIRWSDDMTQTANLMPGERIFAMPTGTVPRGGELALPREERESAAKRRNSVEATAESVAEGGKLYRIYCAPCHGPEGKGDGPVSPKFIPPPDITHPSIQQVRTDGYIHHVISSGGAVMPAYGEALSPEERWHVVNYVRALAKK
ncbi:MAG: c-type cytochrome [Candidatus Methylomirabilia bacterium]